MIRTPAIAARAIAAIAVAATIGLAQTRGDTQPAPARPVSPLVTQGQQIFQHKCAFCHVGPTTGAIMLGRRLGKEHAELPGRTDLDPEYIKGIVRGGLNSMPTITRVELTDEQLNAIAAYLTRNNPPAPAQ